MIAMACPEVNNPAKVTFKGTPKFVIDEAEPFSSWLLPRQSASYSTESAHEIGADIEVGGETELSGAVAKAKVSLKIKIAEKNSVKRNFTVSDKNDSKKAYRVRLAAWAGRLRGLILQRHSAEWVTAAFVVAEAGLVLPSAAPA